ncbi:sulfated surface glycoprotein 185-like [Phragmites australis]|uniref:sulfated surface glycoprotein 185-like n=1 Tax=Phragmites australis TaxID=29695 RepID=UPI002D781CC1|nr:sulfated surface glycoprotein 185-like [Phragmites australis]
MEIENWMAALLDDFLRLADMHGNFRMALVVLAGLKPCELITGQNSPTKYLRSVFFTRFASPYPAHVLTGGPSPISSSTIPLPLPSPLPYFDLFGFDPYLAPSPPPPPLPSQRRPCPVLLPLPAKPSLPRAPLLLVGGADVAPARVQLQPQPSVVASSSSPPIPAPPPPPPPLPFPVKPSLSHASLPLVGGASIAPARVRLRPQRRLLLRQAVFFQIISRAVLKLPISVDDCSAKRGRCCISKAVSSCSNPCALLANLSNSMCMMNSLRALLDTSIEGEQLVHVGQNIRLDYRVIDVHTPPTRTFSPLNPKSNT